VSARQQFLLAHFTLDRRGNVYELLAKCELQQGGIDRFVHVHNSTTLIASTRQYGAVSCVVVELHLKGKRRKIELIVAGSNRKVSVVAVVFMIKVLFHRICVLGWVDVVVVPRRAGRKGAQVRKAVSTVAGNLVWLVPQRGVREDMVRVCRAVPSIHAARCKQVCRMDSKRIYFSTPYRHVHVEAGRRGARTV